MRGISAASRLWLEHDIPRPLSAYEAGLWRLIVRYLPYVGPSAHHSNLDAAYISCGNVSYLLAFLFAENNAPVSARPFLLRDRVKSDFRNVRLALKIVWVARRFISYVTPQCVLLLMTYEKIQPK
jgi:hypothetical protein